MAIFAMMLVGVKPAPGAELGKLPYLIWPDYFQLVAFVIILLGFVETATVYHFIRYKKEQLGFEIDKCVANAT